MAFMKYAYAQVIHPHLDGPGWNKVRTAAVHKGEVTASLSEQATGILGSQFKPDQYLLTHATIVCSVDVLDQPGVKTGSVEEDGQKVVRNYTDFRIDACGDKYINNNMDAWSRDVLMKSYRTFVGAHNFVEHVQVEDLSKGRIIDAVARDIGESVYVDILIATDRKHKDLVAAIEAGSMGTMSMGCSVDFTLCTKCGHVAADETEMCKHIKYEKGNTFFDDGNNKHRVAELCGHHTVDPTGGVTFIEASWVATPAFAGAVMRNIIVPAEVSPKTAQNIRDILSSPPKDWVQGNRAMAASENLAGWDEEEEDSGGGEEEQPAQEEESPLDGLQQKVVKQILQRAKQQIFDDLSGGDQQDPSPEESSAEPNDTVIKEGLITGYRAGLAALLTTSSSPADLVNRVAAFNYSFGIEIPVELYRVALRVGSTGQYETSNKFLRASEDILGRKLNKDESRTLTRLGTLISRIPATRR
jgi:hypothetical protein